MKSSARIVLIDDDRKWLEALAEYLRSKGFLVRSATNPFHGLALAAHDVALVVCDYQMPGMDGVELVRRLQEKQRGIAVLVVSSEEGVDGRAISAGARGFVDKGVAPHVLLRRIRELVDASNEAEWPTIRLWQRLVPSPRQVSHRRCS
jgi:two-component system response regulator ChvI